MTKNILSMKKRSIIIGVVSLYILICGLIVMSGMRLNGQIVFDSANIDDGDSYFEQFTLRKGSYDVVIEYETDTDSNILSLVCEDYAFEAVLEADDITLYSNKNKIITSILINDTKDCFRFNINRADTGFLNIKRLYVCHNMNKSVSSCFKLFLVMIVICLIFISQYLNINIINKKIFMLCTISFISCIPLLTNYLFQNTDLFFHLLRIEGIKDGIMSGNFPVRVQPSWLNGYGYASSIMYGDIFLYIPAMLRMFGFSLQNAYKIYVVLVNILTSFTAYLCINKIFKDSRIALIGSLCYVLAPYRFTDMYVRSAVGEYTAMIFLPIIICGLYCIIGNANNTKELKQGIVLSIIGFTGIIQSHVLTCELVGAFVILAFLLLLKKIFTKTIFSALCRVAFFTILINLWWLVPFLDYMKEDFNVSLSPGFIQRHGTFIAQLLLPITETDGIPWIAAHGISNEMPQNIGLSFCVAIFLFFYILVCKKEIKNKMYYRFSCITIGLGVLALYATTIYFPYDKLMDVNLLFQKLFGTMQFPWRFLGIATALLLYALCAVLAISKNNFRNELVKFVSVTIIVCTIIPYAYGVSSFLSTAEAVRIYDIGGLDTTTVVGGEYLPIDTDISKLKEDNFIISNDIVLKKYKRQALNIEIYVENKSSSEGYIDLPLLYYKGYSARDIANNISFDLVKGDNNVVHLKIPPNYFGRIIVCFRGMWYWHIADIISILTLCSISIYYFKTKFKSYLLAKN